MRRQSDWQEGFSVIEILLVLLVAAVIVATGLLLYQHRSTNTKTTGSTNSTQPSNHAAHPTTQYFTIKEWNIEAKPDSTFTLRYKIWPSNLNVADFTSDQLTAASSSPGCGIGPASGGTDRFPGYYGGGYITRLLPSDLVYGLPADDSAETPEQYAALPQSQMGGGAITKIGGYYYVFHPNQGPCADTGNVQQETQAAVKNLLQSFQPVQS